MENNALIKVDLKESLSYLGIPFMEFQKGDRTLRFLLDTGASMNFIKKEILEEYSTDAEILPYKSEYFGIDNVNHQADMYSFTVESCGFQYKEEFQTMHDSNALIFPLEDGDLVVHGILGTPFFKKYKARFFYDEMEMYFSVPDAA